MSKADWVSAVRRTDKPWGHEELFALVDGRFCGKAMHVNKGHALSLQGFELRCHAGTRLGVALVCGSRSAGTRTPLRSSTSSRGSPSTSCLLPATA